MSMVNRSRDKCVRIHYLRRTDDELTTIRPPTFIGSSFCGRGHVGVAVSQRTHANLSAVLNLDGLDDRLHRIGDDLGVRMPDNDVAVALVAVAARRAGLGEPGLDDQAADP